MKLPKAELTFLGALASLVVTACSGDGPKPGGAAGNPAADGAGTGGNSSSSGGTGVARGLGSGGAAGTGGSIGVGGASVTGGTSGMGGSVSTGGTVNTGGSASTGGTENTGGATGATPFKGIAYNGICDDLGTVGATWFYSWSTSSDCRPANGAEYVPMFWGSVGNPSPQALYDQGYRTVLTFNEPERSEQANLTVSNALALWPELEATGLRLGSPATASSGEGEAWLADFMEQAEAGGHRVDFIALHWYGWGVGGCANINAHFTGFIERAAGYGRPIWITEWGCYGDDAATVKAFYETAVAWLLEREDIERYAWFLTRGQQGDAAWDGQKLIDSSANLTPLGDSYVASQAMR